MINFSIFYSISFCSAWILRITERKQEQQQQLQHGEIKTGKEKQDEDADFFPSQDRKRNMHTMYDGNNNEDIDNDDESVDKKKKKVVVHK